MMLDHPSLDKYALLIPCENAEQTLARLREQYPAAPLSFGQFAELEALLPLANQVFLRLPGNTLEVLLYFEDAKLLSNENLAPPFLSAVADSCYPEERAGHQKIKIKLLVSDENADVAEIKDRLTPFRIKTEHIRITATYFNAETGVYWSTAPLNERLFEKSRLRRYARQERTGIANPQISHVLSGPFNQLTFTTGGFAGFAFAVGMRLAGTLFDLGLPDTLYILGDVTGGMLACGMAMFAGRKPATGALQGLVTTLAYCGILYPFLLFLGPENRLLGLSFMLNLVCLPGMSFLLGRILERRLDGP